MTRSRRRKLVRHSAIKPSQARTGAVWLPLAPMLIIGSAFAAETAEIVVTAQKREQNLQDVPISVQALTTTKLEQLGVTEFDDYANLLPSVSFVTFRPGFAQIYMRGVASAGDGDSNHSGSAPLVGTYLDEQPITTIQGALDIHLYDVARVEALAGPQGTLYGASSEAGTVKIVTNKPDLDGFAAGYGVEGNAVTSGETGYLLEGFVNVPLSDNMAVRAVGWARRNGGFIDNVARQRTFPSTVPGPGTPPGDADTGNPIGTDTTAAVRDDYNTADTFGARAALRIDLNDNWTVTPGLMVQRQETDGNFGADNTLGEYKVAHGYDESSDDQWYQASLVVEGRIGNFDLVYAGSYLDRDVDVNADYSDYSYWYDVAYDANGTAFSSFFYNDANEAIDFSQYIVGFDRYKKQSHEIRISSPQDRRLRGIAGVFYQQQKHDIEQNYLIDDLATALEVTGREDTIWLTKQDRKDDEYAVFGELYYDLTEKLTATLGARVFKTENSLIGFFGFGQGYSNSGNSGESRCDLLADGTIDGNGASFPDREGAPCVNLDDETDDNDTIWKGNLSYKITDDALIYVTYAEGFRPGGINRRGTVPPYKPDFLDTYEVGWKTSWLDDRLRFNGAAFYQEWNDFQYSILGPNGLTEITNAAEAEIEGVEMDISMALTDGLGISAGVAFINAELSAPYCANLFNGQTVSANPCPLDDDGDPDTDDFEDPQAFPGDKLPVTPEFKGNLTARYQFDAAGFESFVQGAMVYVGDRGSDLRRAENAIVGELPAYTLVNLSAGIGRDSWDVELFIANAFDEYAEFSRFAQCAEAVCGQQTYSTVAPPRTWGIKFSQEF